MLSLSALQSFLSTSLWCWLARVWGGDLGTEWVFDDADAPQSQRWMFGGIEERTYATPGEVKSPAGIRALVTFNLVRQALVETLGAAAVGTVAVFAFVLAFAQGMLFGMGG